MSARALHAYVNTRAVGVLRESDDVWAFQYDPEWVHDPQGFALSPALPRQIEPLTDGASVRPVQWYFDNLLPEEGLRTVYAREANLPSEDAFGLLAYFGAESAGSLTLLPPGSTPVSSGARRALTDADLSARIRELPREPLIHAAPKNMSVAGAQHKLLVVLDADQLYEPLPGGVSTHLLKPNHPDAVCAHSVINEYFTMELARGVGLPVPQVFRRYVPEPVYVVARFDRVSADGEVRRLHAIDSCQLLNRARTFKYQAATVSALTDIAHACRSRAAARLWLYRWLVFNLLVGNADNHLKNISALVSSAGIDLAPAYDLLSTAVYTTRAMNEQPTWPQVELAIPLPGALNFAALSRDAVRAAAAELEIPTPIALRELDRMLTRVPTAAEALVTRIEAENHALAPAANANFAGELRLVRAIRSIVIGDTVGRLQV